MVPPRGHQEAGASSSQRPSSSTATLSSLQWSPITLMPSGMFKGRWMSHAIQVAQNPQVGRRKTEKDRRPLAPSPVVRIYIREYGPGGTGLGRLVDPSLIEASDLLCSVTLMEPRETHESSAKAPAKAKAAVSDRHDSGDESDVEDSSAGSQPGASEDEVTLRVRRARTPPRRPPPTGRNLYGSLHVGGVKIIPMDGESLGVWFLFTDLCVRHEGWYSLRFQCFDMTAIGEQETRTSLGDGLSTEFQVFAPRNFPGLPKPTQLSEHFARQGYKLNTRKNERQAASPPPSPAQSTSGTGDPGSKSATNRVKKPRTQ